MATLWPISVILTKVSPWDTLSNEAEADALTDSDAGRFTLALA
ncbi:MAG: hypothetical protein SOX26_03765 [Phocaeicola sp.]|nr:hypothetical protein [Phocaeicola sp.]